VNTVSDPFVLLKKDHREVEQMLQRLQESRPGTRRRQTVDKLEAALTLHMGIEERLIYPLVAEVVDQESEQEAEVEHNLAREGVAKLRALVDAPGFGAAVAMLTAGIKHHVREEEREVFPELKRGLDRSEVANLGEAVVAAKRGSSRRRGGRSAPRRAA
jgi:iron-sulfur cluster repair protein YtfE (RIC family)